MTFFHKTSFKLFGRNNTIILRSAGIKTEEHIGIGNRCADGKYVLFIDYDKQTPKEWVDEEVQLLQDQYLFGAAFVFSTKRGHHVVFLEKLTITEVVNALNRTTCDKDYMTVPLYYARKEWVLRQTDKKDEKITYLGRSSPLRPETRRECSLAHALYLETYAGVPAEDIDFRGRKFDTNTNITLARYHVCKENN